MTDIYFDTALAILRLIKKHSQGISVNEILTHYPNMHRSKLSRYLTKLESLGYIYRIRTKSSSRGMPPHLWFYGKGPGRSKKDEQTTTL